MTKLTEFSKKRSAGGALDLLDMLADVIGQACYRDGGLLDSMAISAYADALRLLAEYGRVEIIKDVGRRVIARWV